MGKRDIEFIIQALDSKKREELLESTYSTCHMSTIAWIGFFISILLNDFFVHLQYGSQTVVIAFVCSLGVFISSDSDIKILLLAKRLQENEDSNSGKTDSSAVDESNSGNATD